MVFLYSGFSNEFSENIKPFIKEIKGRKKIALLLQGGKGYEEFVNQYVEPLQNNGISTISIIVPDELTNSISEKLIEEIKQADGIFIGGGWTGVYWELYCNSEIKTIIQNKHNDGTPIAGLSAGAKIMTNNVYLDHIDQLKIGLSLVNDMQIFPHFEEASYAYKAINFSLRNVEMHSYGLETNAYIVVGSNGEIKKYGSGNAYLIKAISSSETSLNVIRDNF